MDNEENIFFEICRIRIARELDIPPDDIDIIPLINCCKRAIIDRCGKKYQEEAILNVYTEREKKAVFSEYGPEIINKVFSCEKPFYSWAEIFEDKYVKEFLEKINKEKFNKE